MDGILDAIEVEIRCQACGKTHRKSVAWLKAHAEFRCTCRAFHTLDTDDFRRQLASAERAAARLHVRVVKLNK